MSSTHDSENAFGSYVRGKRMRRRAADPSFSVQQVAQRVGIDRAYLTKIESGKLPPPSEKTIRRLAKDLQEDPDVLLALAGKISSDLKAIILKRPELFAQLIRELRHRSKGDLEKLVREVRDGNW
jgi:transcriptional regulator with XRE-family HTH domain